MHVQVAQVHVQVAQVHVQVAQVHVQVTQTHVQVTQTRAATCRKTQMNAHTRREMQNMTWFYLEPPPLGQMSQVDLLYATMRCATVRCVHLHVTTGACVTLQTHFTADELNLLDSKGIVRSPQGEFINRILEKNGFTSEGVIKRERAQENDHPCEPPCGATSSE